MAIEIFWGSGSTPAWRVLLGFLVKGVPYESRLLSFSNRDTRTPQFLAMNPRGKVPTVREGEFSLGESLAILAWLDQKFPNPPLFGTTPEETGHIWRECLEFENYFVPQMNLVVRPLLFGAAKPETEVHDAALATVTAELDALNAKLAHGWIVGETLSAADIVWFCGLQTLIRASTRAGGDILGVWPLHTRWPNVLTWAQRFEALPDFDATFPPHWLEGDRPSPARLA